jgi:hypothetical protein
MKVFENTALIKLDSNRDLYVFTKHGLHLNNTGRELVAKKIVSTIKHMLNIKKNNLYRSRDSVATGYGLDDQGGAGVRVPVRSSIFSSPRRPDRL